MVVEVAAVELELAGQGFQSHLLLEQVEVYLLLVVLS